MIQEKFGALGRTRHVFFLVSYMDVVHVALKYGFWIFGGYVRDVIIRGENTYNDIDIGCTWNQMHLVPRFLEEIGGQVNYDTLEKTGRTQHHLFPYIRRLLDVRTIFETIDIVVFSSFDDFLVQDGDLKVSCNNFYKTRDGLFMRGNFTKKDIEYYNLLTLQKKFVVLTESEFNFKMRDKLLAKGWLELLGNVR
jgi:hypothetical protein